MPSLFTLISIFFVTFTDKQGCSPIAFSDRALEQRTKWAIPTDSLDYDLNSEMGWYTTGGVLEDDVNTLTSIYGEYSPATKVARFRDDVILVNNKDGYRMTTEELEYNTGTHIANISRPTRIEGANDTIITTEGWYNTTTDHAQLTSRSTIVHSDSNRNVTTLEGDSIIYDKATRVSRAYMFRDIRKQQRPMVLTDTARKVVLYGGYGEYNDSTRKALAAEYPLLIEYSRPDSLFLRADTIVSLIKSEMVWPDSLASGRDAATRARLRQYKSLGEIAGSMPISLLLLPKDVKNPGHGLVTAVTETSSSEIAEDIPDDTTEFPSDSVGLPRRRLDRLGRDSAYMVSKDFHVAMALKRARVFNKDIQGIADTLIFRQVDSMLYMISKPVVWSGERQVYGNLIEVHFNDSTAFSKLI